MSASRFGLCLCLLGLAALPASAAGTISNALSARQAGRGGTNLAFSDNGVLLLDNPAGIQGLVGACECQDSYVDLGGVGLFTDLTYADSENSPTAAADNPSGLGHLMLARRLHEDVVIGFGVFAPAGFGSDYDLQGSATLPGPHTYKSFGALLRILPGASLRLTENLTVGATLGVAVSHLEIEGPYYLNYAPLAGTPSVLDLQSTGAALSWSCGLQYALSDSTIIGLRYQSENEFHASGKASVAIQPLGTSYYDVDVALTWPQSWGLGLLHHLDGGQRVAVDFGWELWEDAYDAAYLTFHNPDNPVFEAVAGPRIPEVFPLGWKDSLIVSVGYEKDLSRNRTLRCGYRYQDNPVPAATTSSYLQTTLEHHFALGYGFQHAGWQIDTAYQFAFAPDVASGASAYAGGDFSDAVFRTQTHMLFVGAMRRF